MLLVRYVYYPCAIVLACLVIAYSQQAAHLMQLASQAHSPQGATELALKSLLETWSFSLYSGAEDMRGEYGEIAARANFQQRRAVLASWALAGLTGAQLVLISFRNRPRLSAVAWHTTLISTIAFGVGIVAPTLTVLVFSDVPILGTVVLKYDTKSIASTIGHLLGSGNFFLALLIGLFSIILPVVKVTLMLVALAPAMKRLRDRSLALILMIGNWSMADVYVVGVLVASLAFTTDELSDARIGIGLYYFATYCILSLTVAHIVRRMAPKAPGSGGFPPDPAIRE